MTMREKMARALYGEVWDVMDERDRHGGLRAVDAVLAVLEEPSEGMVTALERDMKNAAPMLLPPEAHRLDGYRIIETMVRAIREGA